MTQRFDVAVIGGGPGGYIAAIRAAQLGLSVACIDAGRANGKPALGGTCTNVGCIPSKALLQSSHLFEEANHGFDKHGIKVSKVELDLQTMLARKDEVVKQNTTGIEFLLKKNKVDVIWGEAKITKPGEVIVGKSTKPAVEPQHPVPKGVLGEGTYQAKHIIIATGARPRALPGIEPDKIGRAHV